MDGFNPSEIEIKVIILAPTSTYYILRKICLQEGFPCLENIVFSYTSVIDLMKKISKII